MTLLHTDTMHPIFRYELWNKNLVYEWKIHGRREFAPFFAELIHCALDILGDGSALPIVPVPPRKGKMRLLGWDQIDDICCELHCKWGYSIYRMLIRDSPNQQKSLGKQERIFMSRGQYHLKSEKEIKKITKGEIPPAVILLDDVITTGATIECCAECLKKAGIKKVHGVTLFAT